MSKHILTPEEEAAYAELAAAAARLREAQERSGQTPPDSSEIRDKRPATNQGGGEV